MKDKILTDKLRYLADHGNIDRDRCVEIAQAAFDALVEHFQGGTIDQLAAAMVRCCGNDEDEAATFRCAVDSLLQERWNAKPKDSAGLTGLMNMAYQGIWSALRAEQENEDDGDEDDGDEDDGDEDDGDEDDGDEDDEQEPEANVKTLRFQCSAAIRVIDVDTQADLFEKIEAIRDTQIDDLASKFQALHLAINGGEIEPRLDWLGDELMAHLPRVMNQELKALIVKNREAGEAFEFEESAKISTQIFENFGRTIAKLAIEIALLREEVKCLRAQQ